MNRHLACLFLSLIATLPLTADERTPSQVDLDFFEKRIRPVLANRCYECHSARATKLRGGLRLDSRDELLRGGDNGPAVGSDVEQSLFVKAIRYASEDLQMPPAGKLPDQEIADLVEWVRRGAPFPAGAASGGNKAGVDLVAGRKHWAFQPVAMRRPPEAAGVRTIDAFLAAERRKHGLQASPEAPPATLLRRLKFDLLGLPPTPEELQTLPNDSAPDAYERLVDRYLASPQFGERWGRFWLDMTRYADVPESWNEGKAAAWLYRDWVVRAMNADLPYDDFVRKQLAADLLPGSPPEDVAALGFLGLSPTYWKELKLDHNVIKAVVAEEWEERIDALTGTFLGLTAACSRCHDHKFDPITMQDYYGLAGVFASVKLADRPVVPPEIAKAAEEARARVRDWQMQIDKLKGQKPPPENLTQQLDELRRQIDDLRAGTPHFDTPTAFAVVEASLQVLPDGPHRTRLVYQPNQPQDIPMQIRGNPAKPGPTVPRGFLAVLSRGETPVRFQQGSGRRELAEAIVGDAGPLAARVIVNRIWRHHFGRGLVVTPSNFGSLGDRPSHPELLDDLAARFIASGWSLKWLHREIVLSAAYRQSSRPDPARQAIDPDNVWLWRMTPRRLEVEAWRDVMLSVTGELDSRLGGPAMELTDANHRRRTLYGMIRRRELADVLRLHDFPDPVAHSGTREPTTTPLQQLFVLNSPFLLRRGDALAARLQAELPGDPAAQIRLAYRMLFAREATEEQVAWGVEFLSAGPSPEAWRQYAQALLASNEFFFVD